MGKTKRLQRTPSSQNHRMAYYVIGVLSLTALLFRLEWFKYFDYPIFFPDSPSYFVPAIELLSTHQFPLDPYRTVGYPLFLSAILGVFRSFFGVLVVQHLLSIMTAILTGFLFWRFVTKSLTGAALIGFATMMAPRGLVFSHSLLTETVYVFWVVVVVGLLLNAAGSQKAGRWMGVGLATMVATLIRPMGMSLCAAALVVSLAPMSMKSFKKQALPLLLILAVVYSVICALNYAGRGFWGLTQMGGMAMFGNVAKYLNVEKIGDEELRNTLAPSYQQHKENFDVPKWVRMDPKGPTQALKNHPSYGLELDDYLRQLSRRAILDRPVQFVGDVLGRCVGYLWGGYSRFETIRKDMYYIRGLRVFQEVVENHPSAGNFLKPFPIDEVKQFSQLQHVSIYPFERKGLLVGGLSLIFRALKHGPFFVVLIGMLALINRERRTQLLPVLAVILCHLGIWGVGGDNDWRYMAPLDPLFLLLLSNVLFAGRWFGRGGRLKSGIIFP